MKRYVWSERSTVYHDRLYATERCNRDDKAIRREGDEPPPDRRLCRHCYRKAVWARANHPDIREPFRTEPQEGMAEPSPGDDDTPV